MIKEFLTSQEIVSVRSVVVFDSDDVIGGLVALVARISGRPEADKPIVAAENQLRTIDDRYDESLLFADRFTRRVQTAVHPRRQVAPVNRAD